MLVDAVGRGMQGWRGKARVEFSVKVVCVTGSETRASTSPVAAILVGEDTVSGLSVLCTTCQNSAFFSNNASGTAGRSMAAYGTCPRYGGKPLVMAVLSVVVTTVAG